MPGADEESTVFQLFFQEFCVIRLPKSHFAAMGLSCQKPCQHCPKHSTFGGFHPDTLLRAVRKIKELDGRIFLSYRLPLYFSDHETDNKTL
jgi:hypothetical protein